MFGKKEELAPLTPDRIKITDLPAPSEARQAGECGSVAQVTQIVSVTDCE